MQAPLYVICVNLLSRETKERTILDTFAEDFVDVVEKHAKYVIVSGFVAIAHGRSRGTEDVDIIIERIKKDAFIKMHNDLLQAGFECIQSEYPEVIYDDYLKDKTSVRYVRKGHFIPEMELKLAKDAKHMRIIYSDVLDENEITKIKAEIRRLRLS